MTRKDYEKIAAVLSEYKLHDEHKGLCARMADMLGLDNPRFDRARFLKACGI